MEDVQGILQLRLKRSQNKQISERRQRLCKPSWCVLGAGRLAVNFSWGYGVIDKVESMMTNSLLLRKDTSALAFVMLRLQADNLEIT